MDKTTTREELARCRLKTWLHGAAADVSVVIESGGRIVLLGSVTSYYQKQLAQEALIHLPGGGQVVNNLEVNSALSN